MADPRYPIGRFVPDPNSTPETRARHMEAIAGLPSRLSPILFQVGTASCYATMISHQQMRDHDSMNF
jgi:hypothetical protein